MPQRFIMDEQPFAEVHSARPVLDQIANKWSVLILTVLCPKPSRFNAIMRRLDGITHKALTEALRRLERNGLVNRRVIASSPVAVEYSITPLGRSLQAPFEALYAWLRSIHRTSYPRSGVTMSAEPPRDSLQQLSKRRRERPIRQP